MLCQHLRSLHCWAENRSMVGDRFRRRLSKAVGLSERGGAAAFPLGVSFSNFPPSLVACCSIHPPVPSGVPHIVLACPAEIIAENPYLSLPATESSCYHKYRDPFFNFSSHHNLLKYGAIFYNVSSAQREREVRNLLTK